MVFCELTNKLHPRECVCVLSYEVKFEALCSTVASSFFVVSANLSSSKVSIGSSHYYSHRPHFPHSSHTQSSKVGKDLELQMACSDIFVLVQPNGYIKDTVGGATFQSWDPLLMNFDTDHQESLLELKNLILANMGELGRKKISHMAYKLHGIIGPQLSDSRVIWLTSDQDIHLMFDFHVSNCELRCIELYIKVEDMISSASSKANPQVVQSDNIESTITSDIPKFCVPQPC
ncbi:uncharacterized protein LOC107605601 isoform X1 [Arachis ipaensis]|uniref:uncharacterized protein LOC107605601 isoform X1 n=1 Tax=Arachis ipaensis TaxID=130454 RepID=UPI0007AFCD91|nr:uncharacterized protein LOC107605601 isoform X1 [Arachis ipaensis]XP_025660234.1 uncharacterized protein LOC112756045 isoform X1 [Arachis hypogaea]